MRLLGTLVAVWLLALFLVLGAWAASSRPAAPPFSGVAPEAFSQTVSPGERLCVPGQVVPAGAASIQLTLGTFGRPVKAQVAVRGESSRGVAFRGKRAFREAQNVDIPIRPAIEQETQVELCVLNQSRNAIQIGGKPGVGVSFRYPTADRPTWLESAGAMADRFRYGRVDPVGTAAMWIALALGLAAAVGSAVIVIRASR